jgi:hypothetical protein
MIATTRRPMAATVTLAGWKSRAETSKNSCDPEIACQ